jgi:hypothetical protein
VSRTRKRTAQIRAELTGELPTRHVPQEKTDHTFVCDAEPKPLRGGGKEGERFSVGEEWGWGFTTPTRPLRVRWVAPRPHSTRPQVRRIFTRKARATPAATVNGKRPDG